MRRLRQPSIHLDRRHIRELQVKAKMGRKSIREEIKTMVVYVDVLRKRANSNVPCDPELQNEDNKMIHSVIEAVGCIPAFARPFLIDSSPFNTSPCNRSQYKRVSQLYTSFLQIRDWYTQPCTRATNIVTSEYIIKEKEADFDFTIIPGFGIEFKLEHQTESYRETINHMAFDVATLWSQIGGFIGIFLGYSLLQTPELAKKLLKLMKALF